LTRRCDALGLTVKCVYDAKSALSAIQAGIPDLVCLDVNMPNGNGLKLCELLASIKTCASVPVIILTGRTDPPTIMKCHELCAYYVPKCDDVWSRLRPLICELLEIGPPRQATPQQQLPSMGFAKDFDDPQPVAWSPPDPSLVNQARPTAGAAAIAVPVALPATQRRPLTGCRSLLVVEDDLDMVRTIKAFVGRTGLKVVHCEGLEDTTRLTRQAIAILCDIHLADIRGTFLIHELRSRGFKKPVIMMSGDNRTQTVLESASTGIDAFLLKPFRKHQLLEVLARHTGISCDERPAVYYTK
jgi:CheY-like chemotaxis protein